MSRWFVIVITVTAGFAAFLLSYVLWPNPPGADQPPPGIVPFYVIEGAIESLAFGLGLAFLLRGAQLLIVSGRPRALDVATYLGIGWLLSNWWPHTNLHRVTGFDWYGLIWIEYGFHVTLILSGAVLALAFAQGLLRRASVTARPLATDRLS
jgi:hypothetical protein